MTTGDEFAPFAPLGTLPGLVEQVCSALRARIQDGVFSETGKLPSEATMCSQFGVSRTVVREAVSRLKSEGMVASRQGAGVFLRAEKGMLALRIDAKAAHSKAAVLQIVELRRTIEGESAALAASRRSAEDLLALSEALQLIDAAVESGGDGVAEDLGFHRLIAVTSGNPYICAVLDFLAQYLTGATRVTRANEAQRSDFTKAVHREHRALYDAIAAGDARAARRIATSHMVNAAKRIEQAAPYFWAGREEAVTPVMFRPPGPDFGSTDER